MNWTCTLGSRGTLQRLIYSTQRHTAWDCEIFWDALFLSIKLPKLAFRPVNGHQCTMYIRKWRLYHWGSFDRSAALNSFKSTPRTESYVHESWITFPNPIIYRVYIHSRIAYPSLVIVSILVLQAIMCLQHE